MEFIPMNILEYRLNDDGTTERITVGIQKYQGNEQFNSRVNITEDYVKNINENVTLDSLSREQLERFARLKLRDWVMVERPEEIEEEEDAEETK